MPRPAKPDDEKLRQVGLRLDPADYEMLKAFAASKARTMADVTRWLVQSAIAKGELVADDLGPAAEQGEIDRLLARDGGMRTLSEDMAVLVSALGYLQNVIDQIIRGSARRGILAAAGAGDALLRYADQEAARRGTTVEALMAEARA
ncbi:MAG TPA: hypothetical protein VGB14_12865 [Acidimicrobiales bacterium]|jgi:hypothetical protein